MSDLGWRADGIARALAAGGVELETYRRTGFHGGIGVRRIPAESPGAGVELGCWEDPGPGEDAGGPGVDARRARRYTAR